MPGKRLSDAVSFLTFLSGILLFLALATYRPDAPSNLAGRAGNHAAGALILLFGRAAFLIPLYLVYLGGEALYRGAMVDALVRVSSMIVAVCTAAMWVGLVSESPVTGWIGETIGGMLQFAFGKWGGFILSFGLFLPAAFLSTGLNMSETVRKFSDLIGRLDQAAPEEAAMGDSHTSQETSKEIKRTAVLAGLGIAGAWILDKLKEKKPELAGPALFEKREEEHLPLFVNLPVSPAAEFTQALDTPPDTVRVQEDDSSRIFGGVRVLAADSLAMPRESPSENPILFPGRFNLDQSRFIFRKFRSTLGADRPESRPLETRAESRLEARKDARMDAPASAAAAPGSAPVADEAAFESGSDESREEMNAAAAQVSVLERPEVQEPAVPDAFDSPLPVQNEEAEPEFEDVEEEEFPASSEEAEYTWIATHVPPVKRRGGRYNLPTDILALSPVIPEQDVGREIEATKQRLEKTLKDFDVPGRVTNIQRGPIITLFEVLLDPGVRASRILRIETEIRMNLAVPSVRIVAPLPNKTTVGIEVPNSIRQTVTLGEIIRKDRSFFSRERLLGIALGKDISGRNHYMDIARMPHVLIAGASGQGKSVFMNSMIASLLYRYSPEEVRFIMIDPKMVELTLFQGIPHLLTPVITEPSIAARALEWSLMEMQTRYTHFNRVHCRDIVSYNERVKADGSGQPIPYIVIVIDELADLMQTSSKEVENALWRLAQKARAVGIHMVVATQRPSVDVITPHIKSNAPARIAFKVAQKTDSRIILDEGGGEALLGQGDMLYRSPQSTLDRIQSPLITEQEMASIVTETRRYGEPVFIDLAVPEETDDGLDEDEPIDAELLAEAWKIILESGKTSGSYLQRRLRIGYNRAANVVEALEQKGYLGPAVGNRPREILKRT